MSDEKRSSFEEAMEIAKSYERECMGDMDGEECECKGECKCEEVEAEGLKLRIRGPGNPRPKVFVAGDHSAHPEKEDLGSLMIPGWASQASPVSAPREVPKGRIVGDELTEAFMPTVGKAEFDESKHPRGHGGQFASSPGGGASPSASGPATPATVGAEEAEERSDPAVLIEDVSYHFEDVEEAIGGAERGIDEADHLHSKWEDAGRIGNKRVLDNMRNAFTSAVDGVGSGAESMVIAVDESMENDLVEEGKKEKAKAIQSKMQGIEDEAAKDYSADLADPDKVRAAIKDVQAAMKDLKEIIGAKE